jgi:hypothetical protein
MLITTLQLNDVGVSGCLEQFFLVESFLRVLVKSLQIRDLGLFLEEVWKSFVKFCDQHAKLGTPVANVVDTEDFIAQKFKNAANTVTLDGRSQVADMHILRNIR